MSGIAMTSLQRVLTTLSHREPDRVPLFLLLTMHGAKLLDVSIQDYFASAENVVEGQLRLRERYRSDCYYAFHHAALEFEAWGGDVIFREDGPPNAGPPIVSQASQIDFLEPPAVRDSAPLANVLETIAQLKDRSGDEVPIIGVVMSPFSLPVMQLGFDHYLDLITEQPSRFQRLMQVNESFCVDWANAQLAAGASAICYFDPVSSCTIIPPALYKQTGRAVAQRTLARIQGPTATHFASGRCLGIIDDVDHTGTAAVGVSADEDLSELKEACRGRLSLLGNLNGIAMRRWTASDAEAAVKDAIARAGRGGGFILSDNHGEIPWQVPDEVLLAVSEAVHRWGSYPLDWVDEHER